jgi:membrane-bound lytic murein transglycosylase B
MMHMTRKLVLAAAMLAGISSAHANEFVGRSDVETFIDSMVAEHGFDRAQLVTVLGEAESKQEVLDAIARPAEKTKPWHEYRRIFITDRRIREGAEFWRANREALRRAQEAFSVPAQIIVATLGVETRYGRQRGGYRVIDSLSTLAFDYPPRARFFRSELEQFLLLAREEGKVPTELMGSYAGAMGYGQFIPSSYRHFAVDFDGDGIRDIWDSASDAIGSVANYYQRHGWRIGDGVAWPAPELKEDAVEMANGTLRPNRLLGELVSGDSVLPRGVERDTKVMLIHLEGDHGDEYWVGLHNFYVITRYNRSHLYAMAVYQLAEAILGRLGGVLARSER